MNSDLVGNAAPGWLWKGHRVRLLDGLALARFEREVFGRQFAALQELRKKLKRGDYEEQLARVREQKGAGAFTLTGPVGLAFAQTGPGAAFLLGLILDYDGTTRLDGLAVIFADPKGAAELIREVAEQSGLVSPQAHQTAKAAEKGKCDSAT